MNPLLKLAELIGFIIGCGLIGYWIYFLCKTIFGKKEKKVVVLDGK